MTLTGLAEAGMGICSSPGGELAALKCFPIASNRGRRGESRQRGLDLASDLSQVLQRAREKKAQFGAFQVGGDAGPDV